MAIAEMLRSNLVVIAHILLASFLLPETVIRCTSALAMAHVAALYTADFDHLSLIFHDLQSIISGAQLLKNMQRQMVRS